MVLHISPLLKQAWIFSNYVSSMRFLAQKSADLTITCSFWKQFHQAWLSRNHEVSTNSELSEYPYSFSFPREPQTAFPSFLIPMPLHISSK